MKKREISLISIFLVIFLLVGVFSGVCFAISRTKVIDLLAHPNKIEKGISQKYAMSKSSWERTDLADGTPRWMVLTNYIYTYELIGSPLKKTNLLAGVTENKVQVAELMLRSILLMRACGMSKSGAVDAFTTLVDSVTVDMDTTYYFETEGFRVEMIFYSAMSMLLLSVE